MQRTVNEFQIKSHIENIIIQIRNAALYHLLDIMFATILHPFELKRKLYSVFAVKYGSHVLPSTESLMPLNMFPVHVCCLQRVMSKLLNHSTTSEYDVL